MTNGRHTHADLMREAREKALKARLKVVSTMAGYPTTPESREAAREALAALGLSDIDRDFPDPGDVGEPVYTDAKPRRRQRGITMNREVR